jgi:uncharacterized protein
MVPAGLLVPLPIAPAARRWRWVEMLLLFGALPGILALGPRRVLLPVIVASGLICLFLLLRDRSFGRGQLLAFGAIARGWRGLLLRVLIVAAALLAFALLRGRPDAVLWFPRQKPGIWIGVALLYPIFSALPQEIAYRAFFFHRYRVLFADSRALIAVNAALFGWSHVLVHNPTAVLLATVGGVFFGRTFERARSTSLVALEHAIYGDLVFTIGIGGMFVNGVRLLSRLLG